MPVFREKRKFGLNHELVAGLANQGDQLYYRIHIHLFLLPRFEFFRREMAVEGADDIDIGAHRVIAELGKQPFDFVVVTGNIFGFL